MRKVVTAMLPLLLAPFGQAVASSFVAPLPPAANPSVITLGEAEPAPVEALPASANAPEAEEQIYTIGDSVIAMGADAIPTGDETVAAIPTEDEAPQKPDWLAEPVPLVIRGGIAGDAAATLPDATPAPAIQ